MSDSKNKAGQKKEKSVKLSEDARMRLMLTNKMKEMETEFDISDHIVIDLGNAYTKIGYSGEDQPTLTIPSIYARSKLYDTDKKNEISSYDQKMDVFGYEATESQYQNDYNILNLTPGDHKEKTSKEFLEFLRDALENKMGISPPDYDVIVNISPIKNEENIRIYGRLFIEELGFRALAMVNSSSLSLYSTGRTSGLVVQCGEMRTYTVPIFEGFPLYHALSKNKLGGNDLTEIYRKGILEANLNVREEDIHTLRNIKERTSSVPFIYPCDYYLDENFQDIILEEIRLYKLPDDTIIDIPRRCRLLASEMLFNPKVVDREDLGLRDLIVHSVRKSEIVNDNLKETLVNNIILSGGTTMIHGFSERIRKELSGYKDENEWSLEFKPIIVADNNRYISKWIGMSMIASMSAFDKLFIKKSEYQELGEERFSEVAQIF